MKVTACLYCDSKNLSEVTRRTDDMPILECADCKVMMVAEIKDNTEELYTKEYFEKDVATKQGYDDYLSSPAANLMGKYGFAKLLSTGKKHVDLGSADGSLMEVFAEEGYKTVGLEISADAVAIAKEKGLESYVTNLHTFPKAAEGANVITAYDLLEHADRPGYVLKNVKASLAKDGIFVFSTLSVKKNDPSDYWFGNSLEHYIYYNRAGLTSVLRNTFGEGNFGFVEEIINGVAEFWGFGSITKQQKALDTIKLIEQEKTTIATDKAYYLSIFYNQVSKFDLSDKLLNKYSSSWSIQRQAEATFYHYYVQGRFEMALSKTKDMLTSVAAGRGIFWQAYYHATKQYDEIVFRSLQADTEAKIIPLQEEAFRLNDEIQNIRGSRVLGKIIKVREVVGGKVIPAVRTLPRQVTHGTSSKVKTVLLSRLSPESKKN